MSASMYWRPVFPRPEGEHVDSALHRALARRIWDHDGTLSSDPYGLTKDDLPYLEGLRDGRVQGAQELIDAIKKHGEIEIWVSR